MSNDDGLTSPNPRKRTRQSANSPSSKTQTAMLAQDANSNNAQAAPEGGAAAAGDSFITDHDAAESGGDEDEDEAGKPSDKKAGRRKIKIEFIQDKSRRHITFSKRKAGECPCSLSVMLIAPASCLFRAAGSSSSTTTKRGRKIRCSSLGALNPLIFLSFFEACES